MDKSSLVGGAVKLLLVVATAVVALTEHQSALAASTGDCVTVRMEAPFRLPDGTLYPAGVLTLCDSRTYSPVDNLHRILVGGSSVGVFVSRRRNTEAQLLSRPEILFAHGSDGNLQLIGYSVQKSGRSVAYRMKPAGVTWQANAEPPSGGATSGPVAAIVAVATH